jgi:CDP-diacylglycerol---serine O-phosphatidyltransferase
MRRISLIPNIVTAFSLACGLFVIFKLNIVEPESGMYQLLHASAVLIVIAACADFADGAIARAMRAESEFGFVFDSLADAVTFGVAPSVLMLYRLSLEQGTGLSFFAISSAMLFSICGILRLVRFNVKTNEAKGDHEAQAIQKKHFTGLPIPAGALAAVFANVFLSSPIGQKLIPLSEYSLAIVLSSLMIVLGYLMISRWKFPSLKMLHIRVASYQLVLGTVLLTIFVLYGLLYFFPITLLIASWGYILLALFLSFIRLIAGKKSKTLEDFEPEEEEKD